MLWLLTISILLVALYVGAATWKERELPESISAMVYLLPEGGWRWLWSIWLWAVAFLTLIPAISILDLRGTAYAGFITLACLVFVGAWPLFNKDTEKEHYIGGSAAGIMSQVCVLLINPWMLALWLLLAGMDISSRYKKWLPSWLENRGILLAEGMCYVALICAELTKLHLIG